MGGRVSLNNELPDSPYTAELCRGAGTRPFRGDLENDYLSAHVRRVHRRVRVWYSLAAGIALAFTVQKIRTYGIASTIGLAHLLLLLPSALILSGLAWSKLYDRYYLMAARYLVAVFVSSMAAFIAVAMRDGGMEQLTGLTINQFAIFFFSGLLFREASLATGAVLLCFASTALYVGLPYVMVAKCLVVLLMTSIPAAIIYRDIERAYRTSFLEGALLGELVSRDALSGLMNRRAFDQHLPRVWQQALRDKRYIFVFMIDIDHFKAYNDAFGHQAGDLCLRSVAKVILEYAKGPFDFAARYGGEEFAVILYDLRRDQALQIADEIRERIRSASQDSDSENMKRREVTVSIGIAGTVPSLGRSPLGLVQLADQGLYEAKDAGRDRTVCKGASDYSILETGAFEIFKPKTLRAL